MRMGRRENCGIGRRVGWEEQIANSLLLVITSPAGRASLVPRLSPEPGTKAKAEQGASVPSLPH